MPPVSARIAALVAVCAIAPVVSVALGSASAEKRPKTPSSPPTLRLAPVGEPGVRLTVVGTLLDRAGQPIAGAQLHAYQTDARGRYTFAKPLDEPHARLAGRLRSGSDGRFELRTIRPGGYPRAVVLAGRSRKIPAHIHLDVNVAGHAERRFQIVFADDPLLRDSYWKDWAARLGQPILKAKNDRGGLKAAVEIRLD